MTEEDAASLALLEQELFSDPWSRAALVESYEQKHVEILVAKESKEILGYAIVYCVLDEGEIARIGVSPKRQRQGVGRSLLDTICSIGKEREMERLLLDVRMSNEGARSFYKAYGFVEDGIRPDFYQKPTEDAVLMSLPIKG